jgi:hypothetical protein
LWSDSICYQDMVVSNGIWLNSLQPHSIWEFLCTLTSNPCPGILIEALSFHHFVMFSCFVLFVCVATCLEKMDFVVCNYGFCVLNVYCVRILSTTLHALTHLTHTVNPTRQENYCLIDDEIERHKIIANGPTASK